MGALNTEVKTGSSEVTPPVAVIATLLRVAFCLASACSFWMAIPALFQGATGDTERVVNAVVGGTSVVVFILSLVGLAVLCRLRD